ncbi:sulfatase-like hydrolase/transferase [Fulvivirga sp. M361]|uniref:sulfatase-like hydrolase/transferase n=1 Tax=Fulvivirga sp. M361 TaxID=2594266 RepID=UPI0011799D91|nr:sulfatase-like hydrolase/transferase [Fulvivirga sp. M361]TRX61374.1 sulfatase-like hydrolase/transferase [Fulvivirga sp. M361]
MNPLLLTLIPFLILTGCNPAGRNADMKKTPTNVLLILADDLGYHDVGYHGNDTVQTPRIDELARNGVIFNNGYVTASVCGPTRAGLMTGIYQQRLGSEDNPAPFKRTRADVIGLPLNVPTIAEGLKKAGYHTGVFGKWHLGGERGNEKLMPLQRGFDVFYGFLEGAALYIDSTNREQKYMRGNRILDKEYRYFTDAVGDEASGFIDAHSEDPFLVYLPFSGVHAPLQATQQDMDRFSYVENEKRRKMCAMLYALDRNIGKVVDKLKQHDLMEKTLIVFLSDNGGHPQDNYSYNLPLKGKKGQYYEGGIKIPFFINWSGNIEGGRSYTLPVSSLDIVPTILSATGHRGALDDLDGVDLLPYLNGNNLDSPHQYLYWKLNEKWAIRDKEWKLVSHGERTELYNIATDPNETKDVHDQYADVVERLKQKYMTWNRSNMPARYGYSQEEFPILEERTRRIGLER